MFSLFNGYIFVPECIYVYYLCVGNQLVQKKVLDFLGLDLHAVYAAQCGCWELNPDPL